MVKHWKTSRQQRMDGIDDFKDLKQSAFSKAIKISPVVNNVTIGPESIINKRSPTSNIPKLEQTPKTKYTVPKYAASKPSPIKKLLSGLERLRMEDVEQAIIQRQQQLLDFEKEQQNKQKRIWYLQQQYMITKVQDQERQIFQALEEYNKNAELKNEKLVEYYHEIAERRRKKDQELQEKERQKKILMHIIDVLKKDQMEFRETFQRIVNLTKTPDSSYLKTNFSQISTKLKSLCGKMEDIVAKCKSGNVEEDDIQQSSTNLAELHVIHNKITDEISLEKKRKEEELKNETRKEENKISPTQLKPFVVAAQESATNSKKIEKLDEFVSKKSLKHYSEIQDFQLNYKKTYEQLDKDESLKQFKFDCKKAINIPVNAISGLSAQHILDKFNRLSQLLLGKSVQIGEKYISASNHPQGIAYCMDLLAKKFVLQGDLMISSNPEAAFWYGTIIVSLWNQFPDFGKLLLAHLHKQCPYLVPIYLPKSIDQSDREYYENLGYKYNEDGAVEKQDKFLKRMTGILRLYTAIIVSHPKKEQGKKHPLGLTEGWRWLTAVLNLEPKVDITATLLQVFLETGGFQMQAGYGKQFIKLVNYIRVNFIPTLKKIDTGGPVTRLEVLLQEYSKKGSFEKPSGMLNVNFW